MNGRDFPRAAASIDVADVTARRAVDAPADAPLLAITGRAASGKTETLARRYLALLGRDATLSGANTIVTASSARSAAVLAARIEALSSAAWAADAGGRRYVGVTLDRLAFDILAEHTTLSGLAYDLEAIDAYDAEEIFGRAIAPLFSAEWSDFLGPDIDPEIPGLRAPDRFAGAVLRLIRKLRDAHITPDAFLTSAARGATAFYANPPNLCAPALLFATKDEHRGALAVGSAELERQRRRELDLAKIITKIYRSYVDELVAHGCLTPSDAIAEATRLLEDHPAIARGYRGRFRIALVDDAHDLSTGSFRMLGALFGKTLAGVTVAGDPEAATQTFAGARPERVFGAAAVTLELQANYRVPAQIFAVAAAVLDPARPPSLPGGDAVRTFRAATSHDEAAFVAASIAASIAGGVPAHRIAVLHRSLRTLGPFEDALIDRNVPIALRGDAALFARRDTLDALALLWSTVDPFAHAWLLRVLQMPLVALSDASLATLCGEPANAQAALFDLPVQEPSDGTRRWDRRRDLRLGTNVVRGDRDADLDAVARERVAAFRRRREDWQRYARTAGIAQAARAIVTDGGMYVARPGETAARTARRAALVDALIAVLARFEVRRPSDDLSAALAYCDRIARSESGPEIDMPQSDAVVVAAIDRVKCERFDQVFIVDVRAGSFPPYYVPDAFLFSPTYGMVPKDSVGEAVTARTAKFTWYAHQAKLRENYSREDRRALAVALTRADVRVTVSASGRPTRGVAAPELLAELQALQPSLPRCAAPETPPPLTQASTAPMSAPMSAAAPVLADSVPETVPRLIAADRVAEMTRCVICAPRRTIAAALEASVTLLSGRLPAAGEQIEGRDVAFAFALGDVGVFGSVPAVLRHAGRLHVAIARSDEAAAALAIHALREHVAINTFFVETADGVFDGPHDVDVDATIALAAAVLAGRSAPMCREHALT